MKPRHSKLIVTPSNWQNGGPDSLLKPWQISYYFFDELHLKGKQIRIKGMNYASTLSDRRAITKALIEDELKLLGSGYNPITHERTAPGEQELNENTFFIKALRLANDRIVVEHHTRLDIKYAVDRIERHGSELLLSSISEITRRDVVRLLDRCVQVDKISPYRYNKTKAYLSILFSYLEEHEAIDFNFVKGIASKKKTINLRRVITTTERDRLYVLEELNYTFYRFIQIFFASGSRLSELLRLQVKDVDLSRQEFKVLIKKGSYSKEEMKPISNDVLSYCQELAGNPDDYVFSERLEPGANKIRRDQVTRRFNVHCKKGLGIKADLYTLKHAHLDDIARLVNLKTASDLAGHTSQRTTEIYATQEKQRRLDELKGLKIGL